MENFEIPLHPFLVFLVVLARVGGVVTFAPFWSHKAANAKIRVILACFLSIALMPVITTKIKTPPAEIYALRLILAGGVPLGLVMGYVGNMAFSGFGMAA